MLTFFYTIALTQFFSIRPFLSLLTIALVVYFRGIPFGPPWLIYPSMVLLFTGLAVVEFFVVRDPIIKDSIEEFAWLINILATALVILPLTTEETAAIVSFFALDTSILSTVLIYAWKFITFFVVGYLTSIYKGALFLLKLIDSDNDTGLHSLINWGEEGWVISGVVITFYLPKVAIGMFLLTLLSLFLARKYAQHLEHKSQVPCPTCSQPIHASAITCASCRHPNPYPQQANWLGQPKANQLVTDLNAHRLQLVGRKRCPGCATRLKEKGIQQTCPACFTETFANAQQVSVFLTYLNQQLPNTLVICFGLSFIPVVGLIPGVIYYRMSLIASLRGYVPRSTGCLTRWGVRIMNLILIGFQPIPVIGAFVLPLMCLTNFWIYQGIVKGQSRKAFGRSGYWENETPVGGG